MRLGMFIIAALLTMSACEAHTVGCFMGIIGVQNERTMEVDYRHFQLYSRTKYESTFLPFIGCGIGFDF